MGPADSHLGHKRQLVSLSLITLFYEIRQNFLSTACLWCHVSQRNCVDWLHQIISILQWTKSLIWLDLALFFFIVDLLIESYMKYSPIASFYWVMLL